VAVSDDLFRLVKSMSAAEKNYFRRYAEMHSAGKGNHYMKVFSGLEHYSKKNSNYNEDELKKKFDPKIRKQLPVIKNNLYNLILKALGAYNSGSKPEAKINELLDNYDILYSKTLYSQCSTILNKAKKIARDNELYYSLLHLLRSERTLRRDSQSIEEFDKTSQEIFREEQEIISKLKNLSEFDNLTTRAMQMVKKYLLEVPRGDPGFAEIESILNNPLLKDESLALTYSTKIHFYSVNASLLWKVGRSEEGYQNSLSLVKFIENDFDTLRGRYNQYIIALNNLLTYQTTKARYDEAVITLDKLKNLENKFKLNEANRFKIFNLSSIVGISLAKAMGNKELGIETVSYIESGLKKYGSKVASYHKLLIYSAVSFFYFVTEDYRETLKWVSRIINLPKLDVGYDIQCAARMLNLLVQYELGNMDVLEHLIKSTQNFIGKRKFYKFEVVTIEFFKNIIRSRSSSDIDFLFIKMKNDIEVLLAEPDEKNIIENLDMPLWIESKIQKKSILELKKLKEKSDLNSDS